MNLNDIKESLVSVFNPNDKILVAMSGGVDSSITAWAAREAGCHVEGVTLKLFESDVPFWKDAEKIAAQLGIKWHLADYTSYFGEDVISPYIATYKRGETPNPCNLCNRVGKTKYLFDEKEIAGADKVASGHYAGRVDKDGRSFVRKAVSVAKDQSYYLSLMTPYHIGLMVYPLGDVDDKSDVRLLAKELGFDIAEKRDSFEACFLMGEDYRSYLEKKHIMGKMGDFYLHGRRIGPHKGTMSYTIGQRKGLEVSHTEPLYVAAIDQKTGNIELSEKGGAFKRGVRLRECVFPDGTPPLFKAKARLRHKMQDAACLVEKQYDGRAVILFDSAQFAPAPGQVTAIYLDDIVLGGGVVDSIF